MRQIKPYFCTKCGKSYTQKQCLNDGYKLYCTECSNGTLCLDGIPMMLIGVAIGVASLVAHAAGLQIYGERWIFIPTSFGLFLVGILKLVQRNNLRKKHAQETPAQAEDFEGKIPQYIPPEKIKSTSQEFSEKQIQQETPQLQHAHSAHQA